MRRFLSNLIPQTYFVEVDGEAVGRIRQLFNPFVLKYEVDFTEDVSRTLDPRLRLAAVCLLLVIEGRQKS
jgi:hypothetical protein